MNTRTSTACLLLGLIITTSAAQAQEQERPDRPRWQGAEQGLSPQEAEVAWTWEARGLAGELKLSSSQTDRLVQAYTAARNQMGEALREARQAGGEQGRRGRWGVDPQTMQTQRAALESQLSGFLSGEQLGEAVQSLGTFSRRWDMMVHAVLGFDLGQEKTYAALVPIRQYVVRLAGAFEGGDDRQAMRDAMVDARAKLQDGLGKVLTEAQLQQFQEATGRRGMGGGRGGPGPQQANRAPEVGPAGTAEIGKPAPAFTINDSEGKPHSLADYRGRIVVLQWINPDCPVCNRTSRSGKVAAMREQLDEITGGNYVHLAVNSTSYMEPAKGAEYLKANQIDAIVLVDQDGMLGHLYGAKRTPHLFVIDTEGVLRYEGAIDDDERGDKGEAAVNYVVQAVRQITAGETVAPDSTRSYGCTVKYK